MDNDKNKKIRKKLAYYKKVVKNMDNLDLKKEIIREDFEDLTNEIEELVCTVDKYFLTGLTDWIELIENASLHKALKSLTPEEQILLSYVYYKEKTYSEIAKLYEKDRSVIGKSVMKTINKIKSFLCKK